ncbi:MAG: alpha/beta hydrolase [Candidatus Wallbacteria bacterium]|nr:alpha/beta hydrolase [Candidatus Wallbacteria bacterium]
MAEISVKRIVRSVFSIIAAVYVIALCLLYFLQGWLIFPGDKKLLLDPSVHGLPYSVVTIKTSDGLALNGWMINGRPGYPYILFCHGNAENISSLIEKALQFYQQGFSSLFFDYRGFGISEGLPTEQGVYLDAEAAWSYLVSDLRVAPDQIIVYGRSLGGAVATNLAAGRSCKALIVESGFYSMTDMAADIYRWVPVKWILKYPFESGKSISKVHCPVLILHSPDDEIVPFEQGEKLFAAATGPKKFVKIKGDHNDGCWVYQDIYLKGLMGFFAEFHLVPDTP